MKQIINTIGFGFIFLLFFAISCVEDNTVHNFTELNDVTINGIEDKGYEALLGEEFILDPKISTSLNDVSNLEYLWYYYQKFSPFKSDTISTDKILKYTFKDMKIGASYNLTLKVRDKISNVFYQKTVPFTAINKYSKGTLLLCKDNGATELNFLLTSKDKLLENVFTKENPGEKLDANPNKVYSISPYDNNAAAFKAILVLNNSTNGGHYIDPSNFKKIELMKNKLGGNTISPFNINYYCTSQTNDYLICNDKIHLRQGSLEPEANWGNAIAISGDKPNYKLAPMSLHPGSVLPLLYDNLNNRFIKCNSSGILTFFSGTEHTMTAFDANKLTPGMQMLCCGYFSDNNSMWALMKNTNNNKFWVLRFAIEKGKFNAQAKVEITPEMAPSLAAATNFESLSDIFNTNRNPWIIRVDGTPGKMMYVANNNLYILNMNVEAKNNAESKLLDGGEHNVTITKALAHPIITPTEEELTKQYTRIDLCVKDLSLSGKQGGIILFKINQLGGISINEIYRKTGFCDEVVDVDEKIN